MGHDMGHDHLILIFIAAESELYLKHQTGAK